MPTAVDGIKIFDNVDQATKHYCFLPLITLSSWQATVMICGLVIIMKNLNSINNSRPWLSILISHLFQHGFFYILGRNAFYTRGVLVGIINYS